jgi:hypothetical protein
LKKVPKNSIFSFIVGTIVGSFNSLDIPKEFQRENVENILNSSSDVVVVVLGSSHADAGLFGCCGKDRCPPPPKVEICLMICSPCDGCPVPVTLCVPECCVCEAPDVSTRCALIGSGVTHVDYCCCDFSATIRWDRCGEPHVVRTRD